MRKKITLLLCLLLLCLPLSGCAITDWFDSLGRKIEGAKTSHELSDLTGELQEKMVSGNYSQATLDAWSNALDATREWDTLANSEPEEHNIFERIGYLITTRHWTDKGIHDYKVSKAESKVNAARADAEAAEASDPIFLASLSDEEDPGSNKERSNKTTFIIIIVVVVILLLLLFLFLRSRSHKPVKVTAPARKPAPVPVTAPAPSGALADRDTSARVDANKMKACKKMADKLGLNVDEELKRNNGDVDQLYMSLMRMTPLED